MPYLNHNGLVVIGTWFIARSLLLSTHAIHPHIPLFSKCGIKSSPNFVLVVGRVVIGSLIVYQTIGTGSNPAASTAALTEAIRSLGTDQCNCFSFAWEGSKKSGPFPISARLIGRFFFHFFVMKARFSSRQKKAIKIREQLSRKIGPCPDLK